VIEKAKYLSVFRTEYKTEIELLVGVKTISIFLMVGKLSGSNETYTIEFILGRVFI
jgi:hypothetical protein